jgi:hypothetical protein
MPGERMDKRFGALVFTGWGPHEHQAAMTKTHQVIDKPVHGAALLHRDDVYLERLAPPQQVIATFDENRPLAADFIAKGEDGAN